MPGKNTTGSPAEISVACVYFTAPGPQNTERTLEAAAKRARELALTHVLVATSSGTTGVRALAHFEPRMLIVVTHSAGFSGSNIQELEPDNRRRLEEAGARILTAQHAFGGVGRAVRKKFGTYQIDELMASTLRTLGQGTKVAIEICLMAADAGIVPVGEPCIAIGGTGTGADTAVVLRPANAQTFFDLRVMEILAKPR